MKKMKLNPLQLDKETIALLDTKQLNDVIGGVKNAAGFTVGGGSCACGSGGSVCGAGGSTGCGSGSSVCEPRGGSACCGAGSSTCFVG